MKVDAVAAAFAIQSEELALSEAEGAAAVPHQMLTLSSPAPSNSDVLKEDSLGENSQHHKRRQTTPQKVPAESTSQGDEQGKVLDLRASLRRLAQKPPKEAEACSDKKTLKVDAELNDYRLFERAQLESAVLTRLMALRETEHIKLRFAINAYQHAHDILEDPSRRGRAVNSFC